MTKLLLMPKEVGRERIPKNCNTFIYIILKISIILGYHMCQKSLLKLITHLVGIFSLKAHAFLHTWEFFSYYLLLLHSFTLLSISLVENLIIWMLGLLDWVPKALIFSLNFDFLCSIYYAFVLRGKFLRESILVWRLMSGKRHYLVPNPPPHSSF